MIRVANRVGLIAALAAAQPGTTIVADPGNYGLLDVRRDFGGEVYLQSADPSQPAQFDKALILDCAGLILRDLDIGSAWDGAAFYERRVDIIRARNLTFEGCRFRGSLDDNPLNDGWGVLCVDSAGVTFRNCRFRDLTRAIVFERTSGITIEDADSGPIQSDSFNLAACRDVLIRRCDLSGFKPQMSDDGTGDHPDGVQMWTAGQARGCENVTIEDCLIAGRDGQFPQGIFARDELELFRQGNGHKNITLRRNVIADTLWWAALIGGCENVTLESNEVIFTNSDTGTGRGRPATQMRLGVDEHCSGEIVVRNNVSDTFWGREKWTVDEGNVERRFTPEERDARVALWRETFRGQKAPAPTPAPTPAPAPSPSPEPTPAPAPEPTPSPAPAPAPTIDVAEIKRRLVKARTEVNATQDAATRALYAIDMALDSID